MSEGASGDGGGGMLATLPRLERIGQVVAVASCVLLAVFTWSDVVTRALRIRFDLASQFNGYLMAWLVFFTLPAVTRLRQHIAVDFLFVHMSPRLRQWLRVTSRALMLIYLGLIIYLCAQLTAVNWETGTRSQGALRTPVVYPQLGMMVGLALTWIVALSVAVRDARRLLARGSEVE